MKKKDKSLNLKKRVKAKQKVVEKKNDFVKLSKLFKKDSWGRILNALKKGESADNKLVSNNDKEHNLKKKRRKRIKNQVKGKKTPKAFFSKIRRLYKRRNINIKLLKTIVGFNFIE